MSNGPLTFARAIDHLAEERSRFLRAVNDAEDGHVSQQVPVYADEEFGKLKYCEQQAVFERASDEPKAASVEQAATVNQAAADSIPADSIPPEVNDQLLKQEGHGAYTNYHPTLERNGLWIRCFPDLFAFADRKPQFSVRLRGTTERYLYSSFENREYPSWLTCRVMDRLGFDTSNLQYAIIRYDRDYYHQDESSSDSAAKPTTAALLGTLEIKFANGQFDQIRDALVEFDHIDLDVYDYQRSKFTDHLYRHVQIWKGEVEPQGADVRGKCKSCEFSDDCQLSLL